VINRKEAFRRGSCRLFFTFPVSAGE